MRVIAVANQKGGCAKTTTAINLAACLAFLGKKTLLIDLDPQAHATLGLGLKSEDFQHTIYDLLMGFEGGTPVPISSVCVRLGSKFDLIPSDITVSGIEQRLSKVPGREERLLAVIRDLPHDYDFVLIDSPPYLGMLTFNALRACREVIVPVEASYFSLHGLAKIAETIEVLKQDVGHAICVHALITLMDRRTRLARQVAHEVAEYYGERLLRTIIHHNARLRESQAAGKSIVDFDRASQGFQDYMNLARELIERGFREEGEPQESFAPALYPGSREATEGDAPDAFEGPRREATAGDETEESLEELAQSDSPVSAPHEALHAPPQPSPHFSQAPLSKCLPIREITQSPLKTSNGYVFLCRAPGAHRVQLIGDFTKWVPQEMNTPGGESGFWTKTVLLIPGTYKYRFIIDGEWTHDVNNEKTHPNPYGGRDSVLDVE